MILKDDKKSESQVLEHSLHVTMAALDYCDDRGSYELQVHHGDRTYRLCTLGCYEIYGTHNRILQVPLNVKFSKGDVISFSLRYGEHWAKKCRGSVDITGNFIPDEKVMCCCFNSIRIKNPGEEGDEKAEEISKPG